MANNWTNLIAAMKREEPPIGSKSAAELARLVGMHRKRIHERMGPLVESGGYRTGIFVVHGLRQRFYWPQQEVPCKPKDSGVTGSTKKTRRSTR